jgi:hypothetical protein
VSWAQAVQAHAKVAVRLYDPVEIQNVASKCGFVINDDGSNGARSASDARRYVAGLKEAFGPVAGISAELLIRAAVGRLGLKGSLSD